LSRPPRPRDVYQVQRLVPVNKKMVTGDGAEWIWNLIAEHSPDGVQIVDLYQARQPFSGDNQPTVPQRRSASESLDEVHQKRLLDEAKNRETRGRAAGHAHQPSLAVALSNSGKSVIGSLTTTTMSRTPSNELGPSSPG